MDDLQRMLRRSAPLRTARPRFDVGSLARLLGFWAQRGRSRTHLSRLSDRELRDVGLTREQARRECAKAPWED